MKNFNEASNRFHQIMQQTSSIDTMARIKQLGNEYELIKIEYGEHLTRKALLFNYAMASRVALHSKNDNI